MITPITHAQTRATLSAALADEVAAIGGIGVACAECGLSDDILSASLALRIVAASLLAVGGDLVTVTDRSHGNTTGTRTLRIEPDEVMDFRAIPYPDETFALVAFDPPHIKRSGPKSWIAYAVASPVRTGGPPPTRPR